MESRRSVFPPRLLAFALLLAGGWAAASERAGPRNGERGAEAERLYQAGVDDYSRGRFPQALEEFLSVLRLDPSDRAARSAVNRLRAERYRLGETLPAPTVNRAAPPPDEEEDGIVVDLARLVRFERTVGDARDRQGELLAKQGRIAQLLAERRVSLEAGRAFAKDAELHALSRRQLEADS